MIVRPANPTTAYQVILKPIHSGFMQANEACFTELGFSNQQAIWGDILESQRQGLRDTQSSAHQERK
jgi:hypothetical protein